MLAYAITATYRQEQPPDSDGREAFATAEVTNPDAYSVTATATESYAIANGFLAPIGSTTQSGPPAVAVPNPFPSRHRKNRAVVEIDGTDFTRFLLGEVVLEERLDTPIRRLSFELSHPRLNFFNAQSLTDRERTASLTLRTTGGGVPAEWLAWTGRLSTSPYEGPWRPAGSIQGESQSAGWITQRAILRLPANSREPRLNLLQMWADQKGLTITMPEGRGQPLLKPVDLQNITLSELADQLWEVEGVRIQENLTGDGIEVLDEDDWLDGPSVFAFDRTNTGDGWKPEPPDRPITRYSLVGTVSIDPELGIREDGSEEQQTTVEVKAGTTFLGIEGQIITTVTTQAGREIFRSVEEKCSFEPIGVDLGWPYGARWGRVRLEKWTTEYGADGRPAIRAHQIDELTGYPAYVGAVYLWTDLTHHAQSVQDVRTVLKELETITYGIDLAWSLKVVSTPYSLLDAGGWQYDDGSRRADQAFTLQVTQTILTVWNQANPFTSATLEEKWSGPWPTATTVVDGVERQTETNIDGYKRISQTWYQEGLGLGWRHSTFTRFVDGRSYGPGVVTSDGNPPASPFAPPPVSGGSIECAPKVVLQAPAQVCVSADGAALYTSRTEGKDLPLAQTVDDYVQAGVRMLRRGWALSVVIPSRIIPFLRPGMKVYCEHGPLELAHYGRIESITRRRHVISGRSYQETRVLFLRPWMTQEVA